MGDDAADWLKNTEIEVQPKRIKIISKNGQIEGVPTNDLPDDEYDITVDYNIDIQAHGNREVLNEEDYEDEESSDGEDKSRNSEG